MPGRMNDTMCANAASVTACAARIRAISPASFTARRPTTTSDVSRSREPGQALAAPASSTLAAPGTPAASGTPASIAPAASGTPASIAPAASGTPASAAHAAFSPNARWSWRYSASVMASSMPSVARFGTPPVRASERSAARRIRSAAKAACVMRATSTSTPVPPAAARAASA